MKISLFIIVFALSTLNIAQSNSSNKITNSNSENNEGAKKEGKTIVVHDTILVKDTVLLEANQSTKLEDKYYLSILEKTNNQLSLWTNPYGILVAALAVLFTIMTIIAAVIVFRQGKEFQSRQNKIEENYKNKLEEFLNEKKEQIKITEQSYKKLIDEYSQKLENVGNDQKKEIQKTIDELKNRKNDAEAFITASVPAITRNYHKCSKCGFGFEVLDDNLYSSDDKIYVFRNAGSLFGSGSRNEVKTVTCPKCGNLDKI